MSQNGIVLPTTGTVSGLQMTQDTNNALQDLASHFSGPALPTTSLFVGMIALDTTNNVYWRCTNATTPAWKLHAPGAGAMTLSKSAAYTAVLGDFAKMISCAGTWALTITSAVTLSDGWFAFVRNDGSGVITLTPSGGQTVDGAASLAIAAGGSGVVWSDGANLHTVGFGISQAVADARYAGILAAVPAGAILPFAGSTIPSGYLQVPTAATNVSRTTYAALFAAIGTTWGVGDGSTTFGLPYVGADGTLLQSNATLGTTTTGAVIGHTHTLTGRTNPNPGSASVFRGDANGTPADATTNSTGGSQNIAAGSRVNFIIKY